jgi:hypothetical protein
MQLSLQQSQVYQQQQQAGKRFPNLSCAFMVRAVPQCSIFRRLNADGGQEP